MPNAGGGGANAGDASLALRVLVDHALVEAFVGDGRAAVSGFAPAAAADYEPSATGAALFSTCPGWLDAEALAWEMASAPVQGGL